MTEIALLVISLLVGAQATASDDCTDPTTCIVQQGTAGGQ
jgi:hypothetical protein